MLASDPTENQVSEWRNKSLKINAFIITMDMVALELA